MSSGHAIVLSLAEAVADGTDVDWDHAEAGVDRPEEQEVIQQLRHLADVASAARASVTTWGPLHIRAEIGNGTFGTVYRAWDPRLEREVALKLLRAQDAQTMASSFIAEGRLLAQITHPNVVTVHGADVFSGRVGIWMELVSGRTLNDIVREQGPFGAHEAALIARDLCGALAAVHSVGFLHRDVKAQNVMRQAGGRTVLMDFGAGEALQPGDEVRPLRGTPAYLAPELLNGARPSEQSDVYSLGILLFFLVSGEFPITGRSLTELREVHATGRRRRLRDIRPDVPESFVRLVEAATAANPSDRPESAGTLEALVDETLHPRQVNRPVRFRATVTVVAATVVAMLGVAWAAWSGAWTGSAVVSRNSVAVLPFKNLNSGRENDYFSDGMTQDVVAHLASLPNLRVIAGASALRYNDRSKSATDIGAALGVATVLDGSVQQAGGRVRVVSRLVDAETGASLWSETLERDVEDIFALQSEVSRKIALALKGELSSGDAERLGVARGRDVEAFRLYLRGRHAWELRTEDALHRSIEFYEAAIQRDPRYALAYSGLADTYITLGTYGFLPRGEAYARAAAAAEKSVALDATLAEAHLSLGYVQNNRFQWSDAEASFKQAIELKPGVAQAHHWYSIHLTQQGRFAEAIAEVRAALSLDPLSIGANLQLASLLLMARRYEDAISQWNRSLQMDPGFVNAYRGIASAYAQLGLYDKAQEAANQAREKAPLGSEDQELNADMGYLLAVSGRTAEARKIAREFAERFRLTQEEVAGTVAAIYAGLGEADRAFEWLNRARERRDPEMKYLKVDPRWDKLRSDPRFKALLTSLGFVQ